MYVCMYAWMDVCLSVSVCVCSGINESSSFHTSRVFIATLYLSFLLFSSFLSFFLSRLRLLVLGAAQVNMQGRRVSPGLLGWRAEHGRLLGFLLPCLRTLLLGPLAFWLAVVPRTQAAMPGYVWQNALHLGVCGAATFLFAYHIIKHLQQFLFGCRCLWECREKNISGSLLVVWPRTGLLYSWWCREMSIWYTSHSWWV